MPDPSISPVPRRGRPRAPAFVASGVEKTFSSDHGRTMTNREFGLPTEEASVHSGMVGRSEPERCGRETGPDAVGVLASEALPPPSLRRARRVLWKKLVTINVGIGTRPRAKIGGRGGRGAGLGTTPSGEGGRRTLGPRPVHVRCAPAGGRRSGRVTGDTSGGLGQRCSAMARIA